MQRPQLLYLPGMDATGRLFYRQAVELDDLFDIHTFGADPDPEETWSCLAEAAFPLVDPRRPTVLCGESFGACLALAMVCQPRCQWAGMILVNPATSFRRGPLWLKAWRGLRWVPDPIYRWTSRYGLGWLASIDQIYPRDREQLADAAYSVPPTVVVRRLQLLSEFDVNQLPLEQVSIPVMLIAGGRDRILPSADEADRLAQRFPVASVDISPQSGHACLLERHFSLRKFILKPGSLLDPLLTSEA